MKPFKSTLLKRILGSILLLCCVGMLLHSFTFIYSPPTIEFPIIIIEDFDTKKTFLYDKIEVNNKDAFVYSVMSASKRIGRPYEELIFLFYMESGMKSIRADVKNTKYPYKDGTYASGIFQITPIARKFLGISYKELQNSDAHQQVEWFVQYYEKWGKEVHNFADLYLLNYLPSYLGRPDETSIKRYQKTNPQLGSTLGEFRSIVNGKFNRFKKQYECI